jgi:hypothetical protein
VLDVDDASAMPCWYMIRFKIRRVDIEPTRWCTVAAVLAPGLRRRWAALRGLVGGTATTA